MEHFPAIAAFLTGPALAAYGPWGVVLLTMGVMLATYFRGREARLAQINDRMQEALRADQRALFERQAADLEALRVDLATTETRLRETENLAAAQRARLFDQYLDWREAYHAANSARAVLVAAGLKKPEDFEPLKAPGPPMMNPAGG